MAGISQEDIQKVRDASDLVAIVGERVPLRQRGRDFWCCCPFHNEKTPSCKVDPATQLWHCFGCGEGGDVFGFIMKSDDVSFPDAVRMLAQRANIDISDSRGGGVANSRKARLRECCDEAAEFFHAQLMRGKSDEAAHARAYLASRGLGGSVPKTWKLGFAPGRQALVRHLASKGFKPQDMLDANVAVTGKDGRLRDRFFNRVMFPIFDPQGACIAFGGRVIGQGEPKYLNSQETPLFHKSRVLYGLDKAKGAMTSTGTAIVVEGYTDVIALHEAGIRNAVATLGTALTLQHIRLISRHASKRIVYLFDGDAAGQRAADRALEFIDDSMTPEAGKTQVELAAVTLPDDLDPAEFVSARGADALRGCIERAKPLIAYGIDRRLEARDLSTVEARTRALPDVLGILAPIKESILAKDYAVQIASRLQLREQDVLHALAQLKPPVRYDREDQQVPRQAGQRQAEQRPAEQSVAVRLSQAEVNRRRFERELLSLASQHPRLALAHADSLAQTSWHEQVHAQLATCILDVLAENPQAQPGEIVTAATAQVPRAAGLLTSARSDNAEQAAVSLSYLVEELAIGDLEDTVAAMKAQLAAGPDDEDEREVLFQGIVELQKVITRKKDAHRITV